MYPWYIGSHGARRGVSAATRHEPVPMRVPDMGGEELEDTAGGAGAVLRDTVRSSDRFLTCPNRRHLHCLPNLRGCTDFQKFSVCWAASTRPTWTARPSSHSSGRASGGNRSRRSTKRPTKMVHPSVCVGTVVVPALARMAQQCDIERQRVPIKSRSSSARR